MYVGSPKQKAASAANAAIARSARRQKSDEMKLATSAAYEPADAELLGAVEALAAGRPELAAMRLACSAALLGRLAMTGISDPVRHRLALASLREARGLLDRTSR